MSKEAQIERALAYLNQQKKLNYTEAARVHGIGPTTLRRRYKGISASREQVTSECHQRLSSVQEDEILRYIDALSNKYIPPTTQIVKNLIEEILKAEVGKNWAARFVKRHSKRIRSVYLSFINNARASAETSIIFECFYVLIRR